MYENAKPELERIVELVNMLPEKFQATAFEKLLSAYVATLTAVPSDKPAGKQAPPPPPPPSGSDPLEEVPADLRPRIKTLAVQAKIAVPALLTLFDFTVDPFTLGSFALEGTNTFEKARKVALLIGARSYIANGKWTADWAEVKAACVDHSCYDMANFSQGMKKGKGSVFKAVTVGQNIEISAAGQAEAKTLLATLVQDAAK